MVFCIIIFTRNPLLDKPLEGRERPASMAYCILFCIMHFSKGAI